MFLSCIYFSRYFWNFSVCRTPTNVCMYLYKAAFSCLICSNYTPERLGAGNVIPPSSCNCCEPFAKANTHTHTQNTRMIFPHIRNERREIWLLSVSFVYLFWGGFTSVQSRILPGLHIKSKYISYVFVQLTHGTNCRNTNTKSSVSQRPRLNLSWKTKCSGLCPVSCSSSSMDILF